MEASNATTSVKFERDVLGRIVKDMQGDDTVESAFDLLGLRARMKTSKGHVLDIERNLVGDVVGMKAGGGPIAPGSEPAAQAMLPPWEARFTRDQLGLEIERSLPGGVRARWERDNVGRPLKHEIWSGNTMLSAQSYTWEPNDRLKMIVDALRGPVQYRHDGLGNLIGAAYADGKMDLRMPDAVGNLFKAPNKTDRKYGPAGQLLESKGPDGVTKYEYDPEGNLAKKLLPDGSAWTYAWNGAGMLAKVIRPDGETVEFGYDALGRRVWKKYGGKTTKWIWDGNVPVHEWVEVDPALEEPTAEQESVDGEDFLGDRKFMLTKRFAQGPPPEAAGTVDAPITWIFEPESFAPLAKLNATGRYGIVTDHLGTPTAMLDEQGQQVWAVDIGVYGDLRNVVGEKQACPFRWPGQYEDEETGLYYNRFRYYDPEAGAYVSQDPIGLAGGSSSQGYVADPLVLTDPFGLAGCKSNLWNEFQEATSGEFATRKAAANAYRDLIARQSPWPHNRAPTAVVLSPGTRFEMALSPGQSPTSPGGFGTFDRIANQSYVRNELAVKKAWKPDIDRVVTLEVTKPMPALQGTVGPQVDQTAGQVLRGGGSQVQMQVPAAERMDYLRVVGLRPI